jgi:ribonuclease R
LSKKRNHSRQGRGKKNKGQKSPSHQGNKHQGHPKAHINSPSSSRELVGTVQANEKGFGFFIPEDGSSDAFIPPRQMRGILNGDTIRARVFKDTHKEGKFAAELLMILKRAHTTMVGILFHDQGRDYLKPDDFRVNQPIHLKRGFKTGRAGQKAVAQITQWPGNGSMEGEIIEILGFPDDPGVDIKTVIRKYQWPEQFPGEVTAQVQNLPEDPAPVDWAGRMDLRNLPILTIDGQDAKDFDDAISLEKQPNGAWRLGVHIADVAHYVREGTPLDEEAKARATSLYLADRVLPMLPHSLSDGLCSLKEGVPRLTLSAFLTYEASGRLLSTQFAESVIQSRRRGIYEEVQEVINGSASAELRSKYANFGPVLGDMITLSRIIRRQRESAGALDFDFPEVRAVLDESGRVIDVRKKDRLETHRLIEDFMVAANEAVATHLDKMGLPAIYRIHEPPGPVDIEELINFLRAYHIPFKNLDLTTPIGLQTLLKSVKKNPYEAVVSNLALRSLKLAIYSTQNAGHFGLALKSYCHFTSPIRRYPDLAVHRALKKALGQEKTKGQVHQYGKLALHCSAQERNAEKAERESQKILQLRFMENKIGQVFTGPVRHLTPYGLYLELNPYGIEGFTPIENLKDDDYQLDPAALVLRGRRGSKIQLGDILKIKVLSVDMVFQRLLLARVYD